MKKCMGFLNPKTEKTEQMNLRNQSECIKINSEETIQSKCRGFQKIEDRPKKKKAKTCCRRHPKPCVILHQSNPKIQNDQRLKLSLSMSMTLNNRVLTFKQIIEFNRRSRENPINLVSDSEDEETCAKNGKKELLPQIQEQNKTLGGNTQQHQLKISSNLLRSKEDRVQDTERIPNSYEKDFPNSTFITSTQPKAVSAESKKPFMQIESFNYGKCWKCPNCSKENKETTLKCSSCNYRKKRERWTPKMGELKRLVVKLKIESRPSSPPSSPQKLIKDILKETSEFEEKVVRETVYKCISDAKSSQLPKYVYNFKVGDKCLAKRDNSWLPATVAKVIDKRIVVKLDYELDLAYDLHLRPCHLYPNQTGVVPNTNSSKECSSQISREEVSCSSVASRSAIPVSSRMQDKCSSMEKERLAKRPKKAADSPDIGSGFNDLNVYHDGNKSEKIMEGGEEEKKDEKKKEKREEIKEKQVAPLERREEEQEGKDELNEKDDPQSPRKSMPNSDNVKSLKGDEPSSSYEKKSRKSDSSSSNDKQSAEKRKPISNQTSGNANRRCGKVVRGFKKKFREAYRPHPSSMKVQRAFAELCDNAKATRATNLEFQYIAEKKLRISYDGCGMSPEELLKKLLKTTKPGGLINGALEIGEQSTILTLKPGTYAAAIAVVERRKVVKFGDSLETDSVQWRFVAYSDWRKRTLDRNYPVSKDSLRTIQTHKFWGENDVDHFFRNHSTLGGTCILISELQPKLLQKRQTALEEHLSILWLGSEMKMYSSARSSGRSICKHEAPCFSSHSNLLCLVLKIKFKGKELKRPQLHEDRTRVFESVLRHLDPGIKNIITFEFPFIRHDTSAFDSSPSGDSFSNGSNRNPISFGFSERMRSRGQRGYMLYYRNRLIESFLHRPDDSSMVPGVVAVADLWHDNDRPYILKRLFDIPELQEKIDRLKECAERYNKRLPRVPAGGTINARVVARASCTSANGMNEEGQVEATDDEGEEKGRRTALSSKGASSSPKGGDRGSPVASFERRTRTSRRDGSSKETSTHQRRQLHSRKRDRTSDSRNVRRDSSEGSESRRKTRMVKRRRVERPGSRRVNYKDMDAFRREMKKRKHTSGRGVAYHRHCHLHRGYERRRVQEEEKQSTCRRWESGRCPDGDECLYLHAWVDPKKRGLCRFDKTNSCKKLGYCEYQHLNITVKEYETLAKGTESYSELEKRLR
eukprot:jgi/Bigna1/80393/fgenesh1_pg.70_\